jgi:FkbH-like protein
MTEAVRLVIWDLDETFWNGTLSEGGIEYNTANHDLVIALARRGIVSAICSKNDLEKVKAVLVEKGIWDYFVFPSIDWNPKGPRISALIEDIQLRPQTVLFIDDNALNRGEAEHFVPGLQVADVDIIPTILASPLFKGKNDEKLSRLGQYKLLETRKADEAVAIDNNEFLRSCNITVEIERDVESHIDRAIELINRTNQLNFTKNRLPEDLEEARAELKETLAHFTTQAALIRVTDRYGDYGYCGFYLTSTRRGRSRLHHFCFSCRILNMGVERWLYERLGRPRLREKGEVLTDLSDESPVDWISVRSGGPAVVEASANKKNRGVLIRGSCNVAPLEHYFRMNAEEVIGEFNDVRDAISVRTDHSLILRYAIEGVSAEKMAILQQLGYRPADFETSFSKLDSSWSRVLACWIDSHGVVYRHRDTGLLIPFDMRGTGVSRERRSGLDPDSLDGAHLPQAARDAMRVLRAEFEPVGVLPEDEHARALDVIFGSVPAGGRVFVLMAPEKETESKLSRSGVLNERLRAAAERHPGKIVEVAVSDLIDDDETGRGHFHRNVYYKIFDTICAQLTGDKDVETPSPRLRTEELAVG